MEKEDKKKSTTKKAPVKRPRTKKVSEPEKVINKEEMTSKNETINEICKYCGGTFERGKTICPHCRRRQKNDYLIFFLITGIVFLIIFTAAYFAERVVNKNKDGFYKDNCVLVSYSDLVRNTREFKNKDVVIVGTVTDIIGTDNGFSNEMIITINANLIDGSVEYPVTIDYDDVDYEVGLLEGDLIKVYGEFDKINGNIPEIEAEYIELVK